MGCASFELFELLLLFVTEFHFGKARPES